MKLLIASCISSLVVAAIGTGMFTIYGISEFPLWLLILSIGISSLWAGQYVLLGEGIIEDIVKTIVALIGFCWLFWFRDGQHSFVFLVFLTSIFMGLTLNRICIRVFENEKRG